MAGRAAACGVTILALLSSASGCCRQRARLPPTLQTNLLLQHCQPGWRAGASGSAAGQGALFCALPGRLSGGRPCTATAAALPPCSLHAPAARLYSTDRLPALPPSSCPHRAGWPGHCARRTAAAANDSPGHRPFRIVNCVWHRGCTPGPLRRHRQDEQRCSRRLVRPPPGSSCWHCSGGGNRGNGPHRGGCRHAAAPPPAGHAGGSRCANPPREEQRWRACRAGEQQGAPCMVWCAGGLESSGRQQQEQHFVQPLLPCTACCAGRAAVERAPPCCDRLFCRVDAPWVNARQPAAPCQWRQLSLAPTLPFNLLN